MDGRGERLSQGEQDGEGDEPEKGEEGHAMPVSRIPGRRQPQGQDERQGGGSGQRGSQQGDKERRQRGDGQLGRHRRCAPEDHGGKSRKDDLGRANPCCHLVIPARDRQGVAGIEITS